jgi:agmatine deiminase
MPVVCTLDFLHVGSCVLLPIFDIETDSIALQVFKQLFPNSQIIPVLCNSIAAHGGAIHCVT